MVLVESTLRDAKIGESSLNEIVLVGGSTRIPKIKEMMIERFPGTNINFSINPDEAIACGAAIQAAILNGVKNPCLDDVILFDVTPLSLGWQDDGGLMVVVIPRNTSIPCKRTGTATTVKNYQEAVKWNIFQGD